MCGSWLCLFEAPLLRVPIVSSESMMILMMIYQHDTV